MVKHWRVLFYFCFTPWFLLVSIALTVTNTSSGCLFDIRVGQIIPGSFGAAPTYRCYAHSGSSMQLPCSISDPTSTAQSSSVLFGLSKLLFQFSQSSVSEWLSGALSSSLTTGWRLILRIQRTFNIWVRPPGRSFADKAGRKGDLSPNLNGATPSCCKGGRDAFTISSGSKMHSTVVNCMFRAWHSFWVACRFWLPWHISKTSWTLVILCKLLSFASFFISESFAVFGVSNSASAPAKLQLLAGANWVLTTILRTVSPVVFDCLQPITSQPRENLPSTPSPCGMIENISCATLERSAYFECVPSCCPHHSVISGIQNILKIPFGS